MTGGSHWLTYLWVGPAFPGCTNSCLLNSQALPWLMYNYTNWYLMQWFLKWQCCSEIFPDASLQLPHSWVGRSSLLPIWRRTRGSLHSPSLFLISLSYDSQPGCFHLLTDSTILKFLLYFWDVCETLVLPTCPNLWQRLHGDVLISLLWEISWSLLPVCIVVPFGTADSWTK